ncbi:hypothetical protein [Streptomyces sp. MZ04]|uniref:hypothetical protein n=1 Tax=Streptomyces sp. MZ04 TaxID=2559236 RepID=UPI0014330A7A|nr:hypothetical protein [Streptomyces sp. MZ04]
MTDSASFPEDLRKPQKDAAAPSEDVAQLALRYDGDRPAVIMGEGEAIPGTLVVNDAKGVPVACYTAGAPPRATRIVGGVPAEEGELPWRVALY